jgi:single-strand DNA-binding protein
MGNLTRDLEIRYIPSGQAVTTLGLAVNEKYGKGDDAKENTLFVDIVAWGKTAENCVEFLSKGSPVFVEGKLRLETWDDKETGAKRSKISVTALSVQFLSSGKGKPAEAQEPDMFAPVPDDDEVPF